MKMHIFLFIQRKFKVLYFVIFLESHANNSVQVTTLMMNNIYIYAHLHHQLYILCYRVKPNGILHVISTKLTINFHYKAVNVRVLSCPVEIWLC